MAKKTATVETTPVTPPAAAAEAPPIAATDAVDEIRSELFSGLTADDFAGLTDAERAGIEGEDEDEDDGEQDEDGKGAGEDASTDAGAVDAATAVVEAPATTEDPAASAPETEAAEGGAAATAEAGEDEEDSAAPGAAVPDWQMPENHEQRLSEFEAQTEELTAQFDGGQIRAGEFHKQLAQINAERADLTRQIDRAEMAFQMRQSHFVNVTVRQFLIEHPQYSKKNVVLYNALDSEVRRLQLDSADPFEPRLLAKAHANLSAAMVVKDPAPPAGEKAPPKPKPALPPKSEKPPIPPTLARVPGDQVEDPTAGKFARLDRLASTDPLAYEETLAKMSPAERDEYLATG